MGRALIIKGANFSEFNVGIVKFEGKEIFETLLLHKWDLATNGLDSIGVKHLTDYNSGALTVSDGLTITTDQKVYANLVDDLDADIDGITIALKVFPVQWYPNSGSARIVYCCLTTGLSYMGVDAELALVSQNSDIHNLVLKTGGTSQVLLTGITLNAWNTIIITANKTGIKTCVGRTVSVESLPGYPDPDTGIRTNPTQYSKIYLGAYWNAISNITDAHKIKNIRMYRKYMTDVEMQLLYDLVETL